MTSASESENILKFCYRGALSKIAYSAASCGYRDILTMVINRFRIPADIADSLQIANINGYVFEKQIFEYFLLLFPSPEIVFYVRPGNRSITWNSCKGMLKRSPSKALSSSGRVNKHNLQRAAVYSHGTPVRRQNCFLGSLPDRREERSEMHIKRCTPLKQNSQQTKSAASLKRVQKRSIRV